MQFGGFGQFGGGSQFGGSPNVGAQYYSIFKSLLPPGVYAEDETALCKKLLCLDAIGVANFGQSHAQRLWKEIWPQTAEETLEEWEQMLAVVPGANATLAQRQAVITARWQLALPSTKQNLRRVLANILNPEWAFKDEFDNALIDPYWEQITTTGQAFDETDVLGTILITVATAAEAVFGTTAPQITIPFNSTTDGFRVEAKLVEWDSLLDCETGIIIGEDQTDCYRFGVVDNGGGGNDFYRVQQVRDSVDLGVLASTQAAGAVEDTYFVIESDGANLTFKYGTDLEALTTLIVQPYDTIKMRRVGLYAANKDPYREINAYWAVFGLQHNLKENNVEVREYPYALAADGTMREIFYAFVYRNPGDAGTYDIKQAQAIADRFSQAHCLVTVGESKTFLFDDPESLFDRDTFGA